MPKTNNELPKVFLWLDEVCNLFCDHCNIGRNTNLSTFKPTLNLEEKKKIIVRIKEWYKKAFFLTILGGEPLLQKDSYELISFAKKQGAIVQITSNGVLLSQKRNAQKLVDSGLDYLDLSLDSYTPDLHDKTRGKKGTHAGVLKTIDNLNEIKENKKSEFPKIKLNSIIMNSNLDQLVDLVKLAQSKNIQGIKFQPIANTDFFGGNGKIDQNWFKKSPMWPNKKDVFAVLHQLNKLRKKGAPILHSNEDFDWFFKYFYNPKKFAKQESCGAHLNALTLTKEGNLTFCPKYGTFGNIKNDSIQEVWIDKNVNKAKKHVINCKEQCKILANTRELVL